jgi:hypothetical protein
MVAELCIREVYSVEVTPETLLARISEFTHEERAYLYTLMEDAILDGKGYCDPIEIPADTIEGARTFYGRVSPLREVEIGSYSEIGKSYTVQLDVSQGRAVSCTCPQFTYRNVPCKHMGEAQVLGAFSERAA